mgnify:CR=1 FL=1
MWGEELGLEMLREAGFDGIRRIIREVDPATPSTRLSALSHKLENIATSRRSSPAQLARTFHVTRGAMTNTLGKLEWAGHVHIHPD